MFHLPASHLEYNEQTSLRVSTTNEKYNAQHHTTQLTHFRIYTHGVSSGPNMTACQTIILLSRGAPLIPNSHNQDEKQIA